MQKILIIGTTGSGKSTLARQLADKLNLSCIDLDDLHHLPGWQERPNEDFRRLLAEAMRAEKWVIAGNYISKSKDITWAQADTLIWLDMPFWMNFWRLFKRTFTRGYRGEIICNGNKENPKVILPWFFKSWHKNRRDFKDFFANSSVYPHLTFIHLHSYQQAREFLDKAG
jgi:adenylate kinase family enzyme